jgi:hypothetical protein
VAITPLTGAADGYLATYTALVLPQTINNTELFQFTATVDGIANTYAYTPVSQTLTAGSMQAFDINFDLDKVSVTSITASDWTTTDGGTITSTSTMIKKAAGGTWATSPDGTIKEVYVGDIYYSDGSWSSTYDSSKTPIGVVVSTNPDYCEKAKGYGHGLVMALKNAASAVWGLNQDEENFEYKQNLKGYYKDVSGLTNTNVIKNAHQSSTTFDTDYPAFYAAINYNIGSTLLTGCSGWFLPSIGQWWDALEKTTAFNGSSLGLSDVHESTNINYWGDDERTKAVDAFNDLLTIHKLSTNLYDTFAADQIYWSSSEYSIDSACSLYFDMDGSLGLISRSKSYNNLVRPFLAF